MYIFFIHIMFLLSMTFYNINYINLLSKSFRKPNKRIEVVQLNDVMDTMLERAGVENQEYTGPTKVSANISENC